MGSTPYLSNFLQPGSECLVSVAHELLSRRDFVDVLAKYFVGFADTFDDLQQQIPMKWFECYHSILIKILSLRVFEQESVATYGRCRNVVGDLFSCHSITALLQKCDVDFQVLNF